MEKDPSTKIKKTDEDFSGQGLNEMHTKAEDEIQKMPPAEKKAFYEGIGNLGYKISELKNSTMGEIMDIIRDLSGEENIVSNYFNKFANIFKKSAEKDKKASEQAGKGIIKTGAGAGKGVGVVMKYLRIMYDLYDSGSMRGLNPFRHFTAIAMFIGRSSQAAKELRLSSESDTLDLLRKKLKEKIISKSEYKEALVELEKNSSILKNTRVEDVERAMEEAYNIYEDVYGREALEMMKKGEKNQEEKGDKSKKTEEELQEIYREGAEKFKEAYKKRLPEDIQARFARGGIKMTDWYKFYIGKSESVKVYIDRLTRKLEKIENDKKLSKEEKKAKRNELLSKNDDLINDLDRMVGDASTIDTFAYASWMAEKSSKGVATVMIFDTARLLYQNASKIGNAFLKSADFLFGGGETNVSEGQKIIFYPIPKSNPEVPATSPVQEDQAPMGAEVQDVETKSEVKIPDASSPKMFTQVIGGKINTYSEAAYAAVKQADQGTQDNFIHKYFDKNIAVNDGNRADLIKEAVRKISILNLKTGDGEDIKNLVFEGNVGVLKEDGSFDIEKGTGIKEASAVSEAQLRANAEKIAPIRTHADTGKNSVDYGIGEKVDYREVTNNPIENDLEKAKDIPKIENNYVREVETGSPIKEEKSDSEKFLHEKDDPQIINIVANMPVSIKNDEKLAWAYLKILSGNSEEKSQGLKDMFALDKMPQKDLEYNAFEYDEKRGIIKVKNVNNVEGKNILFDTKKNKIGIQMPQGYKSFGISFDGVKGLVKWSKAPSENINFDNIKKIKDLIREDSIPSETVSPKAGMSENNLNTTQASESNPDTWKEVSIEMNGGESEKDSEWSEKRDVLN